MGSPAYNPTTGRPAYGPSGTPVYNNGGTCCYVQELKCDDDSATGYWAKRSSFDTSKVYKDGDDCIKYAGLVSPCLPAGMTERTEAPSSPYDDCGSCVGSWLQAYRCENDAPTGLWIEAFNVSDPTKVWKQGSGDDTLCVYFPDEPQAAPDGPGRLGTLDGPYETCEECDPTIVCCGPGMTPLSVDVTLSGISFFACASDGIRSIAFSPTTYSGTWNATPTGDCAYLYSQGSGGPVTSTNWSGPTCNGTSSAGSSQFSVNAVFNFPSPGFITIGVNNCGLGAATFRKKLRTCSGTIALPLFASINSPFITGGSCTATINP